MGNNRGELIFALLLSDEQGLWAGQYSMDWQKKALVMLSCFPLHIMVRYCRKMFSEKSLYDTLTYHGITLPNLQSFTSAEDTFCVCQFAY